MTAYSILGIPDLPQRAFQTHGRHIQPQGGGKGSAPKQPDYVAAAEATAKGNLDLAREAAQANRVNQNTPWGNLTWSNNKTFDQAGYDAAMKAYQQNGGSGQSTNGVLGTHYTINPFTGKKTFKSTAGLSDNGPSMPNRDDFYSGGDQWTQSVELSPEMQALWDQQNKLQQGMFGAQDAALGRVNDAFSKGFDVSGLPARPDSLDQSQLPGAGSAFQPTGDQISTLDPSALQQFGQTGQALDMNALPGSGQAFQPSGEQLGTYDPNLATNNATDLLMQRINPEMDRQYEALRSQLANQGIAQGSAAYDREMARFGQTRNDAANQAALAGINLGMQQQGLQFNQGLQNRQLTAAEQQQQYAQQQNNRTTDAALQNQQYSQQMGIFDALAKQRAQQTAEQQQQYAQQLGNRQLTAAEQAQQYGQQTTNQQLAAALQQQQFGQQISSRNNAFQEEAYLRNLPMQEFQALTQGNQVSMPQFPGYAQQATTGGPDLLGATQMGYNSALGAHNASMAQQQGMMSGMGNLGGMLGTAFGGPMGGLIGGVGGTLLGGLFG